MLITKSRNRFLTICILLAGHIHIALGPPILQHIRLASSYVRSVNKTSASITDLVICKKLDILALTETWLSSHDTTSYISDIRPTDYSVFHQLRYPGGGGGVGFLVSNKFNVKSQSVQIYSRFQAVCIEISDCASPIFRTHMEEITHTCHFSNRQLNTAKSDFYILYYK